MSGRVVSPEKMDFVRLFRRPRPSGWDPTEVYSVGIMDAKLVRLPRDVHPAVVKAHSFFYKGFREPYYPHIICLTREPLVLMLMGLYRSRGWKEIGAEEEVTTRHIHEMVRPTHGFVNSKKTHVVPALGDSRELWEGRNHKIKHKERIPRAVPLLTDKVFNQLRKSCPTCFMAVLGLAPLPYG